MMSWKGGEIVNIEHMLKLNLVCNQRDHIWEITKDSELIFSGTLEECKKRLESYEVKKIKGSNQKVYHRRNISITFLVAPVKKEN